MMTTNTMVMYSTISYGSLFEFESMYYDNPNFLGMEVSLEKIASDIVGVVQLAYHSLKCYSSGSLCRFA